ncbi:hypothetical protein [Actinoplanes sp. NPDC049599]|uniref:hypothetical protein n=1 Tax=Actinoplanes sp. NPDC049599 TaxID=3363903 RepID=UPI0037A21F0E
MRLRALVVLALVPALLIAAGVGVWYVVTQQEGRYDMAPRACPKIEPVRDIAGAKQLMNDIRSRPGVTAFAGVGDDAYVRDRDFYVRVSNLVVTITVHPDQTSAPDQVKAFIIAVADRL